MQPFPINTLTVPTVPRVHSHTRTHFPQPSIRPTLSGCHVDTLSPSQGHTQCHGGRDARLCSPSSPALTSPTESHTHGMPLCPPHGVPHPTDAHRITSHHATITHEPTATQGLTVTDATKSHTFPQSPLPVSSFVLKYRERGASVQEGGSLRNRVPCQFSMFSSPSNTNRRCVHISQLVTLRSTRSPGT